MKTFPSPEWEEIIRGAVIRASWDPDFRQRLISQPQETIEETASKPLPEGYQTMFVNEANEALVVKLPRTNTDLSEEAWERWSWVLCSGPAKPKPRRSSLLQGMAVLTAMIGVLTLVELWLVSGKPAGKRWFI